MVCLECNSRLVPKNRRKYCAECGAHASALWKRQQRTIWKASGQKYWRDNWASDEERREYFRQYMRRYRSAGRQAPAAPPATRDYPLNFAALANDATTIRESELGSSFRPTSCILQSGGQLGPARARDMTCPNLSALWNGSKEKMGEEVTR
jgi:ribosomal protein L44E